MEHLLVILPLPRPDGLLQTLKNAIPDLKITFLRHEVKPAEAFYKRDMDIKPDILRDVTVLLTMSVVPDPKNAPKLRYIHFTVAGTDHISEKQALLDLGIIITSGVGAPAIAVAEWAFGTILSHYRQLFIIKGWQNKRVWGNFDSDTPTSTLDGKRLGIVGYGSIGRQVARLAQAFGMTVVAYTSRPRLSAEDRQDTNYYQSGSGDPDGSIPSQYIHGTSKQEFHGFLSQNLDVIVLTVPLSPSTKHLIGKEELTVLNLNSPAFLINVARGPIVDHDALIVSLKKGSGSGGLLGAALDVTEPEPLPLDSQLWAMPNVFISPHISSVAPQTTARAFSILQENLRRRTRSDQLLNVVH